MVRTIPFCFLYRKRYANRYQMLIIGEGFLIQRYKIRYEIESC